MKLGKKRLGVIIGLLSVILISLVIIILIKYPSQNLSDTELQSSPISANTEVWDDLTARQQANGSWDDDLETTVIASNALAQSVDLMDESESESESEIEFDYDEDKIEDIQEKNLDSVNSANNWTVDNYGSDAPTQTQALVNYNSITLLRININATIEFSGVTQQTHDIISSSQSKDGSWDNDVQQTSFALYVLKKDENVDYNAISRGEDWLISQQKGNTWGSVLNDSLAVLALQNTSNDLSMVIENIITSQSPNGSFGDIETTAWAIIALSIYDDPTTITAADLAREWISERQNLSDHDIALVSLAESEYLTGVLTHAPSTDVTHDKGPPLILLIFTFIICVLVIILSIAYLRLSEHDALSGTRKEVYEYIKSNPGVSQNAIKRRLDISSSSIRHHLKILEKFEFILPHNDGKYIRYYINRNGYSIYTNGNGYKEIISALRKSNAADIVKFIQKHPRTSQSALAKALNLHPSTIHWHMKHLLSTNLIIVSRIGKFIQYEINGPIDVDKLLVMVS